MTKQKDRLERAGKKISARRNAVKNRVVPCKKIPMLVVPDPLKSALIQSI